MPNVSDFYLDHVTGKAYFEMDDGSNSVKDLLAGELKLCAYSWSEVQVKHDQIKAAGGGELHFVPGANYVVPLEGKVTIDASYVSLKFNRAKIDISAYTVNGGTFGVIFHIDSTKTVHDYTGHYVGRVIEDGFVIGDSVAFLYNNQVVGPTAFLFHSSIPLTSNRVQFNRMRVVGAYKGLAYGSRSYFVRVNDNCEIARNWAGIYAEASAEDYAEKNVLNDAIIGENVAGINTVKSSIGFVTFDQATSTVQLPWHRLIGPTSGVVTTRVSFTSTGTLPPEIVSGTDYFVSNTGLTPNVFRISTTDNGAAITLTGVGSGVITCSANSSGQIFTLNSCSADYNRQKFVLGNGTKLFINSANWEQSYGNVAGETLPPITLTGANTGIWGRNILVYRNKAGLNTDPFYPSFVTADNSSQVVDLEFSCARGMGRVTMTDPDAFVNILNGTTPKVRVLFEVDGVAVTDVPSMSSWSDTSGVIGQLRSGGDYIYGQLANLIAKTGTANAVASDNTDSIATTSVGGSPATVTRKNGRPMLVLQNGTPGTAAKYYVTFLCKDAAARNAWTFFYNTQAVTGAIIVKEMVATFAAKYDGTTVTWAAAPDSPTYSNASGITLTVASDWRRHGWKEHNTTFYPSLRANTSMAITIEIDMTNATGKLLLSHAGFDTITLSR